MVRCTCGGQRSAKKGVWLGLEAADKADLMVQPDLCLLNPGIDYLGSRGHAGSDSVCVGCALSSVSHMFHLLSMLLVPEWHSQLPGSGGALLHGCEEPEL